MSVTEVGEYVRHHACARRFALGFDGQRRFRELPFAEALYSTMDPVLAEHGRRREEAWAQALRERGFEQLELAEPVPGKGAPWETFAAALEARGEGGRPVFAREVQVEGAVGAFALAGRVDFVLVRWGEGPQGGPSLWLVECKASRRDRTYQRLQVVLYGMLVRAALVEGPLRVGGHTLGAGAVEVAVVRIDEATDRMIDLEALAPLAQTDQLERDAQRLLRAGGPLTQAIEAPLEALPFRLEPKCDGCLFNVHCLSESARQRRLELLGLAPDRVRALRREGVATLDQLARLPADAAAAEALRADPEFNVDVATLSAQAQARCATLPGPLPPPAWAEAARVRLDHHVVPLPHRGRGHLPLHDLYDPEAMRGKTLRQLERSDLPRRRLMRVFLCVHYDYVEDRVGALSAHVTASGGQLDTPWREGEGGPRPDPDVVERWASGEGAQEARPVQGASLAEVKQGPWTGDYAQDCALEQALLRAFLGKLVRQIQLQALEDAMPVHFYVWSQAELDRLLEACARVGGGMLRFVRELLGCREALEQLICSSLEHELHTRYALAWTGRGLTVAASLRWFGRRFHWHRRVGRRVYDLAQVFERDLFDFTARLHLGADGQWAEAEGEGTRPVVAEVRARFNDALTAPYWRAYWGTLPDPDDPQTPAALRPALRQYRRAAEPGALEAYLGARAEALRWLEERVTVKNASVLKPTLVLRDLPTFTLDTHSPAAAAVDVLRMDHHVASADWRRLMCQPPYLRVAAGHTLPLRGLRLASSDGKRVVAQLDPAPFHTDLPQLRARASFDAGKLVRLHPMGDDPLEGQDQRGVWVDGRTCALTRIDWETGEVELDVIASYARAGTASQFYSVTSRKFSAGEPLPVRATLDPSITNFVDARVEGRLTPPRGRDRLRGDHAQRWFDPVRPQIPAQRPLEEARRDGVRRALDALALPLGGGATTAMLPRRRALVLAGLDARVQLIQGPPGTGKTTVTAVAVLARVLARLEAGALVLVTAHTHTAVDTLLARIDRTLDPFAAAARGAGLALPPVALGKVFSSKEQAQAAEPVGRVAPVAAKGMEGAVRRWLDAGVLILGATTSGALKLVDALGERAPYRGQPDGFQTPFLVVDEASMMVFAHLFALTTALRPDGELLLAGDHRQLAPILSHDWEAEDRPPAQRFRMHASAFDAIARLRDPDEATARLQAVRLTDAQIRRDGLEVTFRLPPAMRALIQPLYDLDGLRLRGPRDDAPGPPLPPGGGALGRVWAPGVSLVLVVHDEDASHQSNAYEAHLVRHLLDAGLDAGVLGAGDAEAPSVVVVTPHRAQRARLRAMLGEYGDCVRMIDTVERLQGGEAPTVVYSATVSDPAAVAQEAAFLLNVERTNVAFSRPQRRLVVVCGRALIDHIPPDLRDYQTALLWKHLRALCAAPIAHGELGAVAYRVFAFDPSRPAL